MKNERVEEVSEFGKGFVYCLGLFLAHAESHAETFFYASYDHLYELTIPNDVDEKFARKIQAFKTFCNERRLYNPSRNIELKNEIKESLNMAKELLLEYDKIIGNKPIKALYD